MLKVARTLGVGVSTVQRVKADMVKAEMVAVSVALCT
jgi:hypothetical protein